MEHLFKSIICEHCGQNIRVPVYCGDRFCEVCSPARRRRIQEKIKYLLSKAKRPPGYFIGMITVSLPNCLDLGEGIGKLQKSFRRLRGTKLWKRSIRGGLYVIEITKGPSGWHPHIHAIVEQKFISWRAFKNRWEQVSGGSAFHVKRIPAGAAERYITKYVTKPNLEPAEITQVAANLRHVRLFQPFGLWHGHLGAWVKPQYPCPNCGEICWIPFDKFLAESKTDRLVERSPPVHSEPNKRDRQDQYRMVREPKFIGWKDMFSVPDHVRFGR